MFLLGLSSFTAMQIAMYCSKQCYKFQNEYSSAHFVCTDNSNLIMVGTMYILFSCCLFCATSFINMFIPCHGRQQHLKKKLITYSNSLFVLEIFWFLFRSYYVLVHMIFRKSLWPSPTGTALMSPWKRYGYNLTEGRPSKCCVRRHSQASLQNSEWQYTQYRHHHSV